MEDQKIKVYSEDLCTILLRMLWKYQVQCPAIPRSVRKICAIDELDRKTDLFFHLTHLCGSLLLKFETFFGMDCIRDVFVFRK